ncbi:MAG: hypothetical protein Q8L57_01950, partial [bacterium]|nr:hypothetical protein [bacterium]
MQFNYTAKTKDGETQVGMVEASIRELAIDILQRHGLVVVDLEAREFMPFWMRFPRFFRTVSLKELAIFSRQFATLLEAQVPITDSLRTLQKQTENKIFQEKISE